MNPEASILHCVIPGICPPAPRPRARVIKTGAKLFAQIYTPKTGDYATWKRLAREYIRVARGTAGPFPIKSDPIEVQLLFVMPLPQAEHRKTMHVVRNWCRSQRRGDADNLAKGPLDAANGILWADDRYVVRLHVEKIIGEQGEPPRVEMLIQRVNRANSHRTQFEETLETVGQSDRLVGAQHKEVATWQPQPIPTSLPF